MHAMQGFFQSHYYPVLFIFLLIVFAGNIPVGALRSRFDRFSRPWGRCIYVPILFNIALRRLIGLSFRVIPLVILALLAGQIIGSRLSKTYNGPGSRERIPGVQ